MRVITIDPSTHSTGVAFWRVDGFTSHPRPVKPTATALLTSREKDWKVSTVDIVEQFRRLMMEKRVDQKTCLVYCEQPAYQQGNHHTAATGGLVKMAHFCGVLSSVVLDFRYVGINEWKGNLPKDLVTQRIQEYYGSCPELWQSWKKDIWDAVGIGLFLFGEF